MKQKYAIGFITFMLATVLAACVHDYPAMTPDGEEGIDPTLVEVSTEVTLDLELLPLEIITNKAHRGITKPVPENKRITAAASSSKHGATANRQPGK